MCASQNKSNTNLLCRRGARGPGAEWNGYLELAFPPTNLNDIRNPGFAGVRIELVNGNIGGEMEVVDGNLEVAAT